MLIVVMGVSGSGKSTIGKALSDRLGLRFYDADDFHPAENISKMTNNIPLTDEDRFPWLEKLALKLKKWHTKGGAILACSALKESYRNLLMQHGNEIKWVYLEGSFELISERLANRSNHFMKKELLQSQFDTLEIPTYGIRADINNSVSQIIETVITVNIKHCRSL